jgi:hypothetical protein
MCLDTITKKYKKPLSKVQKAYKVFEIFDSGMNVPYWTILNFQRGTWMKASKDKIAMSYNGYNETYTAGFHTYAEESSCKDMMIKLYPRVTLTVYVYRTHTIGGSNFKNNKTFVSEYMYVPLADEVPLPPTRSEMLRLTKAQKEYQKH